MAYVWRARIPRGASVLSPFPAVEFTVYPNECDAFGHLNQAALLALLERARWEALALGPGADLFDRNGVWPALRKAVIEYKAGLFPRDRLRIETAVVHRGTTSVTLRHTVRRLGDDTVAAEADLVFVCVDRLGRSKPIPEEIARFLGPRTSAAHQTVRVPVGDIELGVEVRGEGLPVLFVHGFPFDHTVWRHQIATLGRCKRIAPDLRGVGASGTSSAADGYSMARYAADLVAVLDALGVREAALCGLSMGGYVIFELMRHYPERVKALVLIDTKPEADSAEAKRGRDALVLLAEREGQNAVVEQMLPSLLAAVTRTTQPDVVEQVREMGRRWSVPGLVGALGALRDRSDSTDTLRRIGVPTLVLVGSDDAVAPPSLARAMARRIPGADCHVIAAAGHIAPLEQPLATSRLVADFLNALA